MARCLEAALGPEGDGQGDQADRREVGFIVLAEALWDLKQIRKAHSSGG